jgi:hypothetical protein
MPYRGMKRRLALPIRWNRGDHRVRPRCHVAAWPTRLTWIRRRQGRRRPPQKQRRSPGMATLPYGSLIGRAASPLAAAGHSGASRRPPVLRSGKVAFDVPGERIVQRKQPPGTSAATSETKTVARNGDPPKNFRWEGGHSWPPQGIQVHRGVPGAIRPRLKR